MALRLLQIWKCIQAIRISLEQTLTRGRSLSVLHTEPATMERDNQINLLKGYKTMRSVHIFSDIMIYKYVSEGGKEDGESSGLWYTQLTHIYIIVKLG